MRWSLPLLVLALAGCQNFDYRYAIPKVAPSPSKKMTVVVCGADDRQDVLAEKVTPKYVGDFTASYGRTYPLNTVSGSPLERDLSGAVAHGLRRAGYRAKVLNNPQVINTESARYQLKHAEADRRVMLVVSRWKSDTLVDTQLRFTITLAVLDAYGRPLAERRADGTLLLPGDKDAPLVAAHEQAIRETAKMLTHMLETPAMQQALREGVVTVKKAKGRK